MKEKVILSTAYLPPIEYMALVHAREHVFIEDDEHFQKQSYRSRAMILTANGPLALSIPILHHSSKMAIKEVLIDYKTRWQENHWKTIETAYNSSPFFLYYKDYFLPFYQEKYKYLFDYNLALTMLLKRLLGIDKSIMFTGHYFPIYEDADDYRDTIHPKKRETGGYPLKMEQPYPQVFEQKYSFTPNLSIIDLLFNQGNQSVSYLKG